MQVYTYFKLKMRHKAEFEVMEKIIKIIEGNNLMGELRPESKLYVVEEKLGTTDGLEVYVNYIEWYLTRLEELAQTPKEKKFYHNITYKITGSTDWDSCGTSEEFEIERKDGTAFIKISQSYHYSCKDMFENYEDFKKTVSYFCSNTSISEEEYESLNKNDVIYIEEYGEVLINEKPHPSDEEVIEKHIPEEIVFTEEDFNNIFKS